jgi:hypothetical protein
MQLLPLEKLGPRPVKGQGGVSGSAFFCPGCPRSTATACISRLSTNRINPCNKSCPPNFELFSNTNTIYSDYYRSMEVNIADQTPHHTRSPWRSPGRRLHLDQPYDKESLEKYIKRSQHMPIRLQHVINVDIHHMGIE